jgi:hypothetical protein
MFLKQLFLRLRKKMPSSGSAAFFKTPKETTKEKI